MSSTRWFTGLLIASALLAWYDSRPEPLSRPIERVDRDIHAHRLHDAAAEIAAAGGRVTSEQAASLYYSLALACDDAHDLAGAEAAYVAALRLVPDSPQSLNGLGWFYAEHGIKLNQALKLTTRAVHLDRG